MLAFRAAWAGDGLMGRESLPVGDAEFHAVAIDGTWLVAPTLVLHYVIAHGYLPQPEFVEAILNGRFAG